MSISSKAANCCEDRHEHILTSVSISSRCRLHFTAGNMRPQSYGRRVTTRRVTFPASDHIVAPARAPTSTPARPRYDYCKVQYTKTTDYRSNKQTCKQTKKQSTPARWSVACPRPSTARSPQVQGRFLSPLSPASLS